jgi:hypothetical protein
MIRELLFISAILLLLLIAMTGFMTLLLTILAWEKPPREIVWMLLAYSTAAWSLVAYRNGHSWLREPEGES